MVTLQHFTFLLRFKLLLKVNFIFKTIIKYWR